MSGARHRIEARFDTQDVWPLRFAMSEISERRPKLSPRATQQSEGQRWRGIRPYFPDDRMSFPARAIIVTAGK